MKTSHRSIFIAIVVSVLLASGQLSSQVYGQTEKKISERKIIELHEELIETEDIASTTQKRRAFKNIVRSASSLIKRYPDAPNRFKVLGIIFETQKALVILQDSDRNRDELLGTCKKLMEAPNEYADTRVEADMLLLQIELSGKKSSPEDIAMAIASFADRYRGTPAEARSLMMSSTAAFDMGNTILLKAFRKTLSKRFVHDPLVNAYMRQRFAASNDVHLRGEFKKSDGKRISFPIGQIYLVCFWSQDAPLLKDKIAEITALQNRYKGQFKVFSFNLDELRDGGKAAMKRMKLDWVPMLLPSGTENPFWLSIGGSNLFTAMVLDPHGLASINRNSRHPVSLHKTYEAVVRSSQCLPILRSLCIGDFLVIDSFVPDKTTIPQDTLGQIQACFTPPPMRYRLTPEDEFKNYEKAEKLCGQALTKHSRAPGLWVVHNHRIIALLGMWRLSGESEYLKRAVASAKTALDMDLPPGSATVAQFCIATKALLSDDADTAQVLTQFIEAAGGKDAPGSAYAAALMLSLEAHSRDQYIKYRDLLLTEYANDPTAWAVSSFLLDRTCASRLFEKALPGKGSNLQEPPEAGRLFKASFKTLKGDKVDYPAGAIGKTLAVVFMEKPADVTVARLQKDVVDYMARTASGRPLKDIELVGVFRSDDPNSVAKTMTGNKWGFNAAYVSGNDWSQLCRQFGIAATDRVPNVILARPDGSIMFVMSGASADKERKDQLIERIQTAVRDFDLTMADKALAAENYKEYAERLSTSFPPTNRRFSRPESQWMSPNAHRRKLVWAYMQAHDFKRALKTANEQIAALSPKHSSRESHLKWCRACYGYLQPMCIRIALLRKMGKKKQANEALAMIDFPKCSKGKGVDTLWTEVQTYIRTRPESRRFRYLRDPKVFLAEHEKNMRLGLQNLYGFKIDSDLMMRAEIHEKLGNHAAAKADRRNANVRAWPFKVRQYHPDLLNPSSIGRRKLAQKHLQTGQWKQVLELVNKNIGIHESEPLRCNSMCKMCSGQVQSFGFRVSTLESLGRKKQALVSRTMAGHAQCPPGKELESFKRFPVNRMYGGGSGINRLNFIDTVMTGENPYSFKVERQYRMEFAADLSLRAQALEKLGETEKAETDRKRAIALAYPHGPDAVWNTDEDELPSRYVDLLSVGNEEE